MELQDYLHALRKYWIAVCALTLVGTGAGVLYGALATPTYTASATVFVSTAGAQSAAELQQGNNFTQQRVRTYADLVGTAAVLEPALVQLETQMELAQLRQSVSGNAPLNTTMIEITAQNTEATQAATIADAVAESLIEVVTAIETTDSDVGSPVSLSVVQPAEVPSYPTAPQRSLSVALGLLLGLALGVGFALLRRTLDTYVRGERDVELVTDTPILGGIVFDPKAKTRPLILHADPRSPLAESFRTLRTNLQFLGAGTRHRSFVVTSALASEGKSTTTANLAITLADAGAKVLLVGADMRRPRVADYMSIEGAVGLSDVLIGRLTLTDAVQQWGQTRLFVLPSGSIPPNPSELLGSSRMVKLIEETQREFDVVLYDSPPLLPVTDAAVLGRLVGGSLLAVAAGRTRRHQLDAAIDALENVDAPLSGIVLTMLPTKGPDAYGYGRYGYEYGEDPK